MRGFVRRVRVVELKRGLKKTSILMFYGRSDSLAWDPARYQWNTSTPFMNYSADLGRKILKAKHKIPDVIESKWQGVLPANFRLRWDNTWDSERICKEAGLIWLTWHRAVAINEWRGQFTTTTPQGCPMCLSGAPELVLHRFWECKSAKVAWFWGIHILHVAMQETNRAEERRQHQRKDNRGNLINQRTIMCRVVREELTSESEEDPVVTPHQNTTDTTDRVEPANRAGDMRGDIDLNRGRGNTSEGSNLPLTMKQSIFGHRIPWHYKKVSRIWLLMRGTIMWILWLERLDASYNKVFWHPEKVRSSVWLGMVDYGRLA
jgi:hypothetical protein